MTRKECLDEAAKCVLKDRQNQYGGPENNFERIAQMWNGYLGTNGIKPWDVAAMMGMLKMARARFNPKYADNWIDLAGYAACGVECATAQEEFDKSLDEFQKKQMEHMFKKAEDSEKPKFKPGDRVQYRVVLPSVSDSLWRDATYVEHRGAVPHPHTVRSDMGLIFVKDEDIRPAPKAEGVEELVVSPFDDPQTKEELFQHIVDCNPATFHTPSYAEEQLEHHSRLQAHKPTGEELAEMAEENAHG